MFDQLREKRRIRKKQLQEEKERRYIRISWANIQFLKTICSQSGIDWNELYYVNANKFFTCLQIFGYDENSTMGFCNDLIRYPNIILMLDGEGYAYTDFEEKNDRFVKKETEKQEEANRARRWSKYRKSSLARKQMMDFQNVIRSHKTGVDQITLRIYVYAQTLEELNQRVKKLIDRLSAKSMEGYIQTNNLSSDYMALTSFSNPVKTLVASDTVAHFTIHSEINRVDPNVGLIGYTDNGLYAPDIFRFSNESYDTLDMGGMGSGKSSLRKLFEETYLSMGNHICYIFDIHREYELYAKQLGIESVSVNEENHVNLMQIFHVEDGNIIRQIDISSQISLVVGRFVSAAGISKSEVVSQFKLLLNEFYQPYLGRSLDDLKNEDWFILEDVLKKADQKYKNHEYESEAKQDIYKMRLGLQDMISTYGYLFNERTNIDFDLSKPLRFDVSFLYNNKDKKMKSAYMSLLLNYVSYGMYLNKERNEKEMMKRNVKVFDLERPIYTMRILVDETMQYAEEEFIKTMTDFLKYARKSFCSLGFVFHGTQDFEKTFGDSKSEGQKLIKELFDLCVNKYIGRCGEDTLSTIRDYISVMNDRDVALISSFHKGAHGERQFLAIDNQNRKVKFTSEVTRGQREYFAGGA